MSTIALMSTVDAGGLRQPPRDSATHEHEGHTMKDQTGNQLYPTATHWGNYLVEVRDGELHSIRERHDDPMPSPIGRGMIQAHRSPARVLAPMVREGWLADGPGATRRDVGRRGSEAFIEVSHEEAVELVAGELERVRSEFGNAAIFGGSYGWSSAGRFHHAQSQVHRFLNAVGGYTRSVNSYSTGAVTVILNRVVGGLEKAFAATPTWTEIADHGELVIAFGGLADKNMQVNGGGVAAHRAFEAQRRCRHAGVRVVNVSPLRDDVSEALNADWVPCRPNTDVAVMLGIAHTLVVEGRHDRDFLYRCCQGWEQFERYLLGYDDRQPKDALWASMLSGVPSETILELARDIADARTTIAASFALQRAHHGEQVHWMALTLAAMSGSMGRPGGGLAVGLGAFHRMGMPLSRWPVAALPQGRNPVESFIPVARIADMLLQPGGRFSFDGDDYTYPDIRLVYWAGGNPFHHHQDINRLRRAWQRPDTIVVHEPWWNPLARHADIVFPVATMLERDDMASGRGDHALTPMYRAVAPPAGVRTDYEIFADLGGQLDVAKEFTEGRSVMEWLACLYDETREGMAQNGVELPSFEEFWSRREPIEFPVRPREPSAYERLREDPAAYPLSTASGRIEIYSADVAGFGYDDCPAHPTWLEPAEWLGASLASRYPLHLCSNQPATRLHSQYDHGAVSQDSKVQGREPIVLNVDDARDRGIEDGDVVRVFNERGACLAGAVGFARAVAAVDRHQLGIGSGVNGRCDFAVHMQTSADNGPTKCHGLSPVTMPIAVVATSHGNQSSRVSADMRSASAGPIRGPKIVR
jgi:biotin/methionine sulfoxide reductase